MTIGKRLKQAESRLQSQQPCRILSREETFRALAEIDQDALQQIPDNQMHGIMTGRQIKAVLGAL